MTHFSTALRVLRPASLVAAVLVASGCKSDILNVTNPDVLNVADYNSPIGTTPLLSGVVQDFTVVYSGTQDGFIGSTGNMADEIQATDTFDDRLFPNQRSMTSPRTTS
jgi:hypothetical protein